MDIGSATCSHVVKSAIPQRATKSGATFSPRVSWMLPPRKQRRIASKSTWQGFPSRSQFPKIRRNTRNFSGSKQRYWRFVPKQINLPSLFVTKRSSRVSGNFWPPVPTAPTVRIGSGREAMRDWKTKRAMRLHEFANLRADLDKGLADLAASRTKEFDPKRIAQRGRKLLAGLAPSADRHHRG